jgi:hypothetical protein
MNIKQLRILVEQVVATERKQKSKFTPHQQTLRESLKRAKYLIEGEEPEKKEDPNVSEIGFSIVNPSTNITDLDPADAYQQLSAGNENMPLVKSMRGSTDWSDDAISSAGGAPAIKKWASSIGDDIFQNRILGVAGSIPSAAPAIALDPDAADEEAAPAESGGIPSGKDLSDKALAFVTNEKLNGSSTDYGVDVNVGATLPNNRLTPTSSDVKAGKSLMFGFLHDSPDSDTDLSDMDGAFVTSDNEVLDGNHRWAGANIATGGDLEHGNLNVVQGNAADLTPELVSMGNGLGVPAEAVESIESVDPEESIEAEEIEENTLPSAGIILERWHKLAGI